MVASPIYKHHFDLRTGNARRRRSTRSMPTRRVSTAARSGSPPRRWRAKPKPKSWRHDFPAKPRLVVVGNGMAGMRTVEELLRLAPDLYDITVFGAEPHGNYNRILLSPLLAGEKTVDDIMLNTPEWYAQHGIELLAGDPVVAIDRPRRTVRAESGRAVRYDRLLLATGSKPFILPVPGHRLEGVIAFRDIHDVEQMLAAARRHRHAVVIGGGLLGLEAANGLLRQGHGGDRGARHRQPDGAPARQTRLGPAQAGAEQRGLRFLLDARTSGILGERVTGVCFRDGSQIPADRW